MAFSCLKFLGKQGISKPPTAFSPHTCFVSSRWRSQWIWTDKIMNNAKRRVGLLECEANQAWLNTWTRTVRGHKHPRQRSLCIFVATTLHNSLHFKVSFMDGARECSFYLSFLADLYSLCCPYWGLCCVHLSKSFLIMVEVMAEADAIRKAWINVHR